ncbi:NtaA/DmoA family FMN-dependent monooxygenase [Burkholderia cepacia]|uniref:NtaA/DmoA family FMN-dependent monooxygenase n=1 Tax=Burkholderia cepacia TaxID=292 RepID=UPI001EEA79A8|nr:NtaA/DmoA family FMN-dependent monooxygenase [Burkholderia cepacia]MCE4124424.1 NtaA/DmoA family FMN-dependent monooxygenase [Burkholderia cepacia]
MTVVTGKEIILNVNVLDFGHAGGALAFSGLPPASATSADYYAGIARIAERGTLDAFFLADSPSLQKDPRGGRGARALEPTMILTAVAEATEYLGLIGTLSTTYNDPVELAERFQTLDLYSGGRTGWNAVTTYNPAVSANFGLETNPDRDVRYRRANEFVDVVSGLWKRAIDKKTFDFEGEFFSVHGRLALDPSDQGYPLIVQAGGSPQGRALAGRSADAVFSAEQDIEAGVEHYAKVKAIAESHGRRRGDVQITPGLVTIIGSTHGEARARAAKHRELAPNEHERGTLSERLGYDLSALGLDELIPREALSELPDPALFRGSLGFREAAVRALRRRPYTLREALDEFGSSGHSRVVGTPEDVADYIEKWFRAGAADGFNLLPDAFPSGLDDFVDHVVPILRERGLFRYEYTERTLRHRWSQGMASNA